MIKLKKQISEHKYYRLSKDTKAIRIKGFYKKSTHAEEIIDGFYIFPYAYVITKTKSKPALPVFARYYAAIEWSTYRADSFSFVKVDKYNCF